jgi:hypothetical protein
MQQGNPPAGAGLGYGGPDDPAGPAAAVGRWNYWNRGNWSTYWISAIIFRMHPNVGRDLELLRQLVAPRSARAAFQRNLNLLTSVRRDLSYLLETVRTVCTIHGTTDGTSQVETHFLSGYVMDSLPAEWLPVSIAPSDRDLEVCVLDYDGIVHALAFPCHRDGGEWVDASDRKYVDIQPTQWRKWIERHQVES